MNSTRAPEKLNISILQLPRSASGSRVVWLYYDEQEICRQISPFSSRRIRYSEGLLKAEEI
jgi:hypothetical protein